MNRRRVERASSPAMLGVVLMAAGAVAGAAAPSAPTHPGTTLCQGCHGAHGEGMPAAGIPRLAGQSAEYLQKQLNDYASGSRENPVMVNWAKQLSDAQRAEVSAYYASLAAPAAAPAAQAAANLERGHQLSHQGDETRRVQACDSCHGPEGSGVLHAAPYLAGQSAEYLTTSLKSWQQGTRHNDAGTLMASVATRLQDADIAAVAAYFASLAAPELP